MPDLNKSLDPRCRTCEDKNCADCTQFGTKLLLTDPPAPWPRSEPIKRPKTSPPWEKFNWAKE